MPFNTKTVMQQKIEFVLQSLHGELSFSELCRRYKISRKTGYKWVGRYSGQGLSGLDELPRKPIVSPSKICPVVEGHIISLRHANPEWGAKKLRRLLEWEKQDGKFSFDIPACSTINQVLRRNGLISDAKSRQAKNWQRFEYDHPNDLWQMDFKGYFNLLNGKPCHPLTITDDHSRFNIGLYASENQRWDTVKHLLSMSFNNFGLPDGILTDNGSPWGAAGNVPATGEKAFTKLEKWMIQLNIRILHGMPYHPQTQGKEERFHRTLKAELLQYNTFRDHGHCQEEFDRWREKYNCLRPHEAIAMQAPVSRYQPSKRNFDPVIKPPWYDTSATVRKVMHHGSICFKGNNFKVGKAFIGDYVALKPTLNDKEYDIFYYKQWIRKVILP